MDGFGMDHHDALDRRGTGFVAWNRKLSEANPNVADQFYIVPGLTRSWSEDSTDE